MLALPRSARLATWGSTWLTGDAGLDDVVMRVHGDDEPHDVADLPGGGPPETLANALATLRSAGARGFRVALPRPGDPQGLAGPADLTADATAAGEAVLATGAPYALVPDITAFGPPGDQGHLVRWTCRPAEPVRLEADLAEADRNLAKALVEASSMLARLDVASWRPEVEALLDDVRSERGAAPLPRAYPAQAQALAARGSRVLAVVDFALGDDGATLTSQSAQERAQVLRALERAARHGLAAACNSLEQQA